MTTATISKKDEYVFMEAPKKEQNYRDLASLSENFSELLKLDDSEEGKIVQRGREIFRLFYALDILNQHDNELTSNTVLLCDKKLTRYILVFDANVISSFGHGEQLETFEICVIRTGIKKFVEDFRDIFHKSDYFSSWVHEEGFIKDLDENIKSWHKYFYILDANYIPQKYSLINKKERKQYWWWFPPTEEEKSAENDKIEASKGLIAKILQYFQNLLETCQEVIEIFYY